MDSTLASVASRDTTRIKVLVKTDACGMSNNLTRVVESYTVSYIYTLLLIDTMYINTVGDCASYIIG